MGDASGKQWWSTSDECDKQQWLTGDVIGGKTVSSANNKEDLQWKKNKKGSLIIPLCTNGIFDRGTNGIFDRGTTNFDSIKLH